MLVNRALLWVGVVSYGLYLWHVTGFRALGDAGVRDVLGRAGFTAAALVVTLLVAAASFYGLERHALRLGRRASHRRVSQDADLRVADLAKHESTRTGVP